MAVQIESVKPFSRCWFWGVRAGDTLLSVDGKEIEDILDYDFYMSFEEEMKNGKFIFTAHYQEISKWF